MIRRHPLQLSLALSCMAAVGLGGPAMAARLSCEPLYAFIRAIPPSDSYEAVFYRSTEGDLGAFNMNPVLASSPETPTQARRLLWDGYRGQLHHVVLETMARQLRDCLSTPAGRRLSAKRPVKVNTDCTGYSSEDEGPCVRVNVGARR
ncbi:hypothetical protein G5B46_21810 [Caulobacter sp. 602-2]|uniref:Uncharacterized protein n=1 Tax=Caulobacter sp. 602-2 TaxID=2710887 RepID=A0A6G4R3X0_9CAUL|nr:hypothetical protein [Caulobacter sp. 602-2]NGM52254.1 hypothetical protein [Caulobacter sp. 602-2]